MDRVTGWCIAGFFIFLILFSAGVGESYEQAEQEGYYYGTEKWMWPVPDCRSISSPFGHRSSPTAGATSDHKGIDIPCPESTNVVATRDGTVTVAEQSASEGNWIAVQHDKHYTSYYMHNSQLLVSVGDKVTKGQVIALSGNTGVSTGPHCHFAILKDGNYVDPQKYVKKDEKIQYTTMATTGLRAEMVAYAKKFLGNPYVYGGTSLTQGTDCSGFTMRIYEHFDITIPRTAEQQYNAATKISKKDLMPGDLLFYKDSNGNIGHVTMYIGDNQVIHASNSKTGIIISGIGYRKPCGYGRFIEASYSEEDLRYMAAVISAEAIENEQGQIAVGYCVMNRLQSKSFPDSVKGVVVQSGQFNSPWRSYLNKPKKSALKVARNVLEGAAANPIGDRCFFISASYAKQKGIEKKGINVGDNIFYDKCIW